MVNGVEQFSSKETLEDYKIGSSANVERVKRAFEQKEIIDIKAGHISLMDPMYKHWLMKTYFNK